MAKKKRTTWKELKAIAERNAKKIEQQPEQFILQDVKPYQEEVFKTVESLLQNLENDNGVIRKNKKNLSIINKIDSELELLKMTAGVLVINSLLKRISSILKDNFNYYGTMLKKNDEFRSLKETIESEVNDRFVVKADGSLKDTGFIYALLNDQTVKNTLKQTLYTSIYSNSKIQDTINETKAYLNGHKGRRGAIESFYSKYSDDVFNHADRMSSRAFGQKYGLKWFIYAGTIVKNSRAFCRGKIGGIFNTEEAKNWINETPSPLGISKDSYSPTIHMGGINCRHSPFFITEEMKNEYERALNIKK